MSSAVRSAFLMYPGEIKKSKKKRDRLGELWKNNILTCIWVLKSFDAKKNKCKNLTEKKLDFCVKNLKISVGPGRKLINVEPTFILELRVVVLWMRAGFTKQFYPLNLPVRFTAVKYFLWLEISIIIWKDHIKITGTFYG